VTTFDCKEGAWRDEQFDEAAAQFAAAHRIVLTKTDAVTQEQMAMCHARAEAINPLAQIVATHERMLAVRQAFDSLQSTARKTSLSQPLRETLGQRDLQHPRIHVLTGRASRPVEWIEFSEWLDNLAGLCGERLLRFKAIVRVTDSEEPILVQSVGSTFGVPRRIMKAAGDQDILVIILRDLGLIELREMLPEGPMQLEDTHRGLG
jgi:G3E family GTPase